MTSAALALPRPGIKWRKPDFSGWTEEGEEALAAILEANANFQIYPTPEIRERLLML